MVSRERLIFGKESARGTRVSLRNRRAGEDRKKGEVDTVCAFEKETAHAACSSTTTTATNLPLSSSQFLLLLSSVLPSSFSAPPFLLLLFLV